jgi:hypothetical protein
MLSSQTFYVLGPLQLGDEFEEGEISFILFLATEDLVPDPAPFDHSRAAAFEERLVGVLNVGALCRISIATNMNIVLGD